MAHSPTRAALRVHETIIERRPSARHLVEEFYDRSSPRALGLAYRLLHGDRKKAEAIVEAIFCEIASGPSLDDPTSVDLQIMLLRRVRARCLDHLRASGERTPDVLAIELVTTSPLTEGPHGAPRSVVADMVRRGLVALTVSERTAIELACFDGHTTAAIATRMGTSALHVNQILRSGLQHVAAILANTGERESTP